MPLLPYAAAILTAQLQSIEAGERVGIITIGCLTDVQYQAINRKRIATGFPLLGSPELVYLGKHHYTSRKKDGYDIAQMVTQIEYGCCPQAIVSMTTWMTALKHMQGRRDLQGHLIRDVAVLELTARKPRAEVFSVIPKGDRRN